MANPLTPQLVTGTIGELLAQLRLLQYGVQAAPPLKDSGNDLIALKGTVIKCIQVKTSTINKFQLNKLPKKYHLVILVNLKGEGDNIFLDETELFLITREEITKKTYSSHELSNKIMSQSIINKIFKN